MCRLAAYSGPAIPLENIIVTPRHSLLVQSHDALEAKLAVNGDGFGIAWYDGQTAEPGLYRDVLPAWADGNLTSICRMVRAPLFLAHIRASTTGETSRANCHPFNVGRWSFMHNGQIAQFEQIRRRLEQQLPDDLYAHCRGTTDSELIFLLMLAYGLEENPHRACQQVVARICALQRPSDTPNRLTCVFTDGEALYAFRQSCDSASPTLYSSLNLDNGGNAFASERLDGNRENWQAVPEGSFAVLRAGKLSIEPFEVRIAYAV